MAYDIDILEISDSHQEVIESWLRINATFLDQKVMLKLSQLYVTYISLGLISATLSLSFFKPEELVALDKKFALLSPLPIVERLKMKHELPTLRLFTLKWKSQNVGSGIRGSMGSSTVPGSPTQMRSFERMTHFSAFK